MFKHRHTTAIGLMILVVCTATQGSTDAGSAIVVAPDDLKWEVAHAAPPGAILTVVEGDMSSPGTLTMRMKFPANYEMPPHWHSEIERVTVISGSLNWAIGDKMDRSKTRHLPAGSVIVMPARLHHYAWTSEETVFQLNVLGPRTITYVNASEDPAQKAKSAANMHPH